MVASYQDASFDADNLYRLGIQDERVLEAVGELEANLYPCNTLPGFDFAEN